MENNNGVTSIGIIVAIILGLIVLILSISLLVPNFWSSIGFFQAFIGGSSTESVVNSCKLACIEEDLDGFCSKIKNWNLGDGRKIVGNCYSLSQLDSSDLSYVSQCSKVSCEENVELKCYQENKIVECSEL